MSAAAPYRVEACRLLLRDEILLSGNEFELRRFAGVLNAAIPADDRIAPTLRALFSMTPEFSFGPGARLLSDGTPTRALGIGRASPVRGRAAS